MYILQQQQILGTLALWVKFSVDNFLNFFSYFLLEKICMKFNNLFSGEKIEKYHQSFVCWISPESGKG